MSVRPDHHGCPSRTHGTAVGPERDLGVAHRAAEFGADVEAVAVEFDRAGPRTEVGGVETPPEAGARSEPIGAQGEVGFEMASFRSDFDLTLEGAEVATEFGIDREPSEGIRGAVSDQPFAYAL